MKNKLLAIAGALAMLTCVPTLRAMTLVSTINGYYDVDAYDTPSLQISNSTLANLGTAYDFTNVTLMVTGYQGDNSGAVQSFALPNLAANGNMSVIWGTGCGNAGAPCTNVGQVDVSTPNSGLFAYDYDDSDGGHACLTPDPAGNNQVLGVPGTVSSLCGQPGNFYVTLTATLSGTGALSGMSIFSQFSPNTNASGGFVGWEGLDQQGYSETIYDSHSNGGPNGVLANIYVGTPPPIPEPSSLALLGTGLLPLLGAARRKWLS